LPRPVLRIVHRAVGSRNVINLDLIELTDAVGLDKG
jgi:hypothetical protein